MNQNSSRSLPITLLAVGLMVFLLSAGAIAAPTQLALKFNKGETFDQSTQIQIKASSGTEGSQMPTDMKMSMGFAFEVLDVKPDRSIAMKSVCKEMKVGEMDVGQAFGMIDKSITLTVDSKGRVSDVQGLEDLAPGGGMPGDPLSGANQFIFPYLPDDPIEIGDTWRNEGEIEFPGASTKAKNCEDYVLRDIKELDGLQVAIIGIKSNSTIEDVTMTINSPIAANMEISYHINMMTIEKDGEMLLDTGNGKILGAKLLVKTDQDASVSTGVPGQNFDTSIKAKADTDLTTVYKYGDQETPDLSGLYTEREPAEEKTIKASDK
ncbi:MAG: hypothetical protein ABIH23_06000 [bacterium]